MMASPEGKTFDALRRLRRMPPRERCELCARDLPETHSHLMELSSGRIACSCEACAILFSYRESGQIFARIPNRPRRLDGFHMDDAGWNALMLPIDMAFFVNRSTAQRVIAYYPSPAGVTESLLTLEYWTDLVCDNPALARMETDVEALLVNRTRGRRDYYVVPIDDGYRLTGSIRLHWRGLSGGDEVWQEVERFFHALEARSRVEEAGTYA